MAGSAARLLSRLSSIVRRRPVATVVLPTYEHAQCLPIAAASVLGQSVTDLELFIVGDGVLPETRRAAQALASADRRVRFLDFPKGERKGERYRHAALEGARGKIVAYLGDDDFWFPDHLERARAMLRRADFGNSQHLGIDEDGELFLIGADLARADLRDFMNARGVNMFDFSFGVHRLSAYRRLPHGWEPPPVDAPGSDFHMWRTFLADPSIRTASIPVPTGICTQTHRRPKLSDAERASELMTLRDRFADPAAIARVRQRASAILAAAPADPPYVGPVRLD